MIQILRCELKKNRQNNELNEEKAKKTLTNMHNVFLQPPFKKNNTALPPPKRSFSKMQFNVQKNNANLDLVKLCHFVHLH